MGKANFILEKFSLRIIIIVSVVLSLPMIFEGILRSVGLTDYFIIWGIMGLPSDGVYDNENIKILLYNIFLGGEYMYRPFSLLLNYIYARIIGGEFWVFMLLKWVTKGIGVCTLYLISKELKVSKALFCAVFSFVFFHVCASDMMAFSHDGLAAVSCVLCSYFLLKKARLYGNFSLGEYNHKELLLFWVLFVFTSGTKEINIVFLGTTVLLLIWGAIKDKRGLMRTIPFIGVLFFTVARLAMISSQRQRASVDLHSILKSLEAIFVYVFEAHIAHAIIAIIVIGICLFGIYCIISKRNEKRIEFIFFVYNTITALGMVVFLACSGQQIAARYVIPIYYIVGVILLVAINFLPKRTSLIVFICAVLIPFFSISDIYGQHLAYAKVFQEQQILLEYLDETVRREPNSEVVVTGKDENYGGHFAGIELQESIKHFFGPLGIKWYGINGTKVLTLDELSGEDGEEAFWITTYDFSVAKEQLGSNWYIKQAFEPKTKNHGLEKSYQLARSVPLLIRAKPTITQDVGAFPLLENNYWHLYLIEKAKPNRQEIDKRKAKQCYVNNYSTGSVDIITIPNTLTINSGDCVALKYDIPMIDYKKGTNLVAAGELAIEGGYCTFGFTDVEGNDYVRELLEGPTTKEFRIECIDNKQETITYFVFVPPQNDEITIRIENLEIWNEDFPLIELTTINSWGAFQ